MTIGQAPAGYRVTGRVEETPDTVTLALEPVGTPLPGSRPGQFSMLYAFGVGEIPISISGPAGRPILTHTIRSVGAVSRALCATAPGYLVGVRGPFGTSWDETDAAGQDLLLVAGGIGLAPLRPALLSVLGARDLYRRVTMLIGARSPAELLYTAELGRWRDHGARVEVTVDRAGAGWHGDVGVVTQLIPRIELIPAQTVALICGPEVMMRLTAQSLLAAGLTADRIRVSLERNMQCGVAECGHCQLGPLLLCRDGPVVSYLAAAPLLTAREL